MGIFKWLKFGIRNLASRFFSNTNFLVLFSFLRLCYAVIVHLFCWSGTAVFQSILSMLFQDLSCYVFLFRRQDFCYDHMTSQPLQICFLFIRSWNFNWSACVTIFFALNGASFFCSFAWLKFWSRRTYLTLKNDFLTLKLTFIFFNSKR